MKIFHEPHALCFEFDQDKISEPTESKHFKNRVNQITYKGITLANGVWLKQVLDWKCEKLSVGEYKISHNHGFINYNTSIGALSENANAKIMTMDLYDIIITIQDGDGKPKDSDFSICVTKTSPEVAT